MIDQYDHLLATAKGSAVFETTPIPYQLAYHEEGTAIYKPALQSHIFFRDYLYQFDEDQVDLYHASGPQIGLFYQAYKLKSQKLHASKPHLCGFDCYESLYELTNNDHFILTTRITGSVKHNIIKTIFNRSS